MTIDQANATAVTSTPVFADLKLAQRLERAEAISSARFVDARIRVSPHSGAAWKAFGGTYAMFDGPDSPVTQTFGLGLGESPLTPAALDEIEEFFRARGAAANHEVSPLAGVDTFALLASRGYMPVEFTSVLYRPAPGEIASSAFKGAEVDVRTISEGEAGLWARVSAEGWSDVAPELFDFILDLGSVVARKQDSPSWLAFLKGEPVAAAALSICDSVAHLAGASTIPKARGNGAQFALLKARLQYAAAKGCELALMGAAPGSASQRNAERHGFRLAYTRQKWRLQFK